ncbi:hypothetical protein HII36_34915 [Nonomuraea sp. NN258]|uniref:hypothetical protein n=1 Tax=Nonomuraea antri TaxID=2730852 RepID=UPI001568D1B0|nr:hypothetical protein [Nonomuraea antri]NRQ36993.1 hypothetical protein [Nonomuraea antri]
MGNRTTTGHMAALALVVLLDATVVNIALPSISAGRIQRVGARGGACAAGITGLRRGTRGS